MTNDLTSHAGRAATDPLVKLAEHLAQPAPSIACPHCGGSFAIGPVARFQEQELTFSIKYEGDSISATTVAGVIGNMDKLLRAIAKDVGIKAHVFMQRIEQREREMSFTFLVAQAKPGARKRDAGNGAAGGSDQMKKDIA